jgi:hypothetical protein
VPDQRAQGDQRQHALEDDQGVEQVAVVVDQERVVGALRAGVVEGRVEQDEPERRQHQADEVAQADPAPVPGGLEPPAREREQQVGEDRERERRGELSDDVGPGGIRGRQAGEQPAECERDHERPGEVVGAAVPEVEPGPEERPHHHDRRRGDQALQVLVVAGGDDGRHRNR